MNRFLFRWSQDKRRPRLTQWGILTDLLSGFEEMIHNLRELNGAANCHGAPVFIDCNLIE